MAWKGQSATGRPLADITPVMAALLVADNRPGQEAGIIGLGVIGGQEAHQTIGRRIAPRIVGLAA